MRSYLSIFCALFLLLSACDSSLFGVRSKIKQGELKVFENNHTFSIPEIKLDLDQTFSYKVSNGLKSESLEFVLLKSGEDPIFVQHLLQQNDLLPESYYIFKSDAIEPGSSTQITFKAPSEPGHYHYVAITKTPKESLFGTLIIESPEQENQLVDGEVDDVELK